MESWDVQQQPEFRRWVDSQEGPVPGLRQAFTDAGLSSYSVAAEEWCCENGAAFIGELIDEMESLCASLGPPGTEGLAPDLRHRLLAKLRAHSDSDDSSEDSPLSKAASVQSFDS